jgi:hypothetical protein
VLECGDVVFAALDHARAEAAAEDVVAEAVTLVEPARVGTAQVTHPVGEIRLRGLEDEVILRSEEAVRVEAPAVPPDHPPKEWRKTRRSSSSRKTKAPRSPTEVT